MTSDNQVANHEHGNGTWAETNMTAPEVVNDLERWRKFGKPEPTGEEGQWATTDDLINSIVMASSGSAPAQNQERDSRHKDDSESDANAPKNEYGMWSQHAVTGSDNGGQPRRQSEPDSESVNAAEGDRWSEPMASDRKPHADRAGRRGRFTSGIALLLSLFAFVVAVSPIAVRLLDTGTWILSLLGSLPVVAMVSLPAILLGLRSATKPKGQLGKGRGVASIVICSLSLVTSSALFVSGITGTLRDLNDAALTAKEQTDADNITVIFPGGGLMLNNSAIKVLMRLHLLPDNTLDNGAIPISSANGKVYTGTQEIDMGLMETLSDENTPEPSKETLEGIADGIAALQRQGITVTTDGTNITLKFKDGTSRRITKEEIANLKEFVDEEVVTKASGSAVPTGATATAPVETSVSEVALGETGTEPESVAGVEQG